MRAVVVLPFEPVPAMIAVERLGHDGIADSAGHPDSLVRRPYDFAPGNGKTGRGEQGGGQFLVAGDVDAERRGAGGHRRPDSLLVFPLAELHEGLVIEADVGDVAPSRL